MKLVELKVILVVGDDENPRKWIIPALQENLEGGEFLVAVDEVVEIENYIRS